MTAPVKVVSIVGPGRSGSTLLAQILGEIPGFLNVGELRWLWQRGLLEQRPCGCGLPPARCPQWSEVVRKALGDVITEPGQALPSQRIAEIVAVQRRVAARSRRVHVVRSADRETGASRDVVQLRSHTADLIDAIAATTGARVVIDASKRPVDAAVLGGLRSVDHYVLHLVRDPRAVAFSWGRVKPLPTVDGRRGDMAKRSLTHSAGRWLESNLGCELLCRHVPASRWLAVRYEDFVVAPEAELRRVCTWLGEREVPAMGDGATVRLHANHTVAGNPRRFTIGEVSIRADDEWARAMSRRRQAVVASLTLPLLLRYRYPVLVPG
ncbi:MAG: sulfotransferase [Actinomycetes bacterium]